MGLGISCQYDEVEMKDVLEIGAGMTSDEAEGACPGIGHRQVPPLNAPKKFGAS